MRHVLLAIAVMVPVCASAQVRIGVYDSRAVALAYYNSAQHFSDMARFRSEYEAMKKASQKQRLAEMEARMQALQQIKHTRVFGNASIPDIIESMSADVERIAREANVVMIVSKWDVGWSDAAVERVDVTDKLVDTFKPNAQVQKWLEGLKTTAPVPLAQAFQVH